MSHNTDDRASALACAARALRAAIEPREPGRGALNPLTVEQVRARAAAFGQLFAALTREVIDPALLGQGEGDLLDAEREPANGVGEFPDLRAAAPLLERDDLLHGLLAFCDALQRELLPAEHGDSFVDVAAPAANNRNATSCPDCAGGDQ